MAEKKKKGEFKKEFYIKWHFMDWLNDANVRMLKPEHKGFWIDLLCQMALFFPYGHCSKLNSAKLKKYSLGSGTKKFLVEDLVNQNSKGEVDILIELQVELLLEQQLDISDNMEDELHKFLPYHPDQVKYHIQALEDEGVFSRTPSGIIYSRRMVRDFRKRVVAFKNGRNGGNPSITGKTPRKNARKSVQENNEEFSLVGNLVNQNSNHGVGNSVGNLDKAFPNYNYNYNSENNSNKENLTDSESLKEGGLGETKNSETPISGDILRIASSEMVSIKGFSDRVSPDEWAQWSKFVKTINENRLDDVYVARFINPNDFAEVVKKHGFTEPKWLPVLKRMLATGMKPEHNLYHRIPQFIDYVYKQGNGSNNLHTGGNGAGFDSMKTWGG